MAKSRPWVERQLQTFRFKGRPARALLWKKKVYGEWFEYSKLCGKYPKAFGDLSKFKNFEEWWRHPNYGFELFCEPEEEPPVVEVEHKMFQDSPSKILVSLNLEQSPKKIIHQIRNLLKKKQGVLPEYKSRAKFSPSTDPMRIQVEKIKRYRLAYQLHIAGVKRKDIADRLGKKGLYGYRSDGITPRTDEPKEKYIKPFDLRVVTRDIAFAKKILKRVEKGMFP